MPRLRNKQVKDYVFGESLIEFQEGSEVAEALKANKMKLTVYGIANHLVDENTFLLYNNEIAENLNRIFPAYYQIIRSKNFLYMIFEELTRPKIQNTPQQIQKFIYQIQKLFNLAEYKIADENIFMKTNGTKQLCIIIPYSKNIQKSTAFYRKYHNKSILAQIFCQLIPVKDKNKILNIFSENMEQKDLYQKLLPYLEIKNSHQTPPAYYQQPSNDKRQHIKQKNSDNNSVNSKKSNQFSLGKSTANKLIKQSEQQYPEIDQTQYQQLMKYVHVNPNLKAEAQNAYMRQSAQTKKQQASNQITQIVENVNTSIFKINTYKSKDGKSKVQIKLNKKKLELNQFQVHFQAHYNIFNLIKLTIRAYLDKYPKGFTGIIAAYLLTLIGILRRLRLYTDLESGIDVYEIGGQVEHINYQKYTNIIKKDLAKQARNLVNLRNIIQNANMPFQTYNALIPFLNQDLQEVVLEDAQKFCFFYMTVLMRMDKSRIRSYREIIFLQMMYVIISPLNSIVYSQEDMPKQWDQKYFQLKTILISTLIPQWSI